MAHPHRRLKFLLVNDHHPTTFRASNRPRRLIRIVVVASTPRLGKKQTGEKCPEFKGIFPSRKGVRDCLRMFWVVNIERLDLRKVVDDLIHPLLQRGSVVHVALLLIEYAFKKDGFCGPVEAMSRQDGT